MHNANCGVMNNNNRHHFDSYFGRIFSFKTCVQRVGLWTISSNMSVGVSLRRLVCVCVFGTFYDEMVIAMTFSVVAIGLLGIQYTHTHTKSKVES